MIFAMKTVNFLPLLFTVALTYQFDTRKLDQHLMQNLPDSVQQKRLAGQNSSKSSATVQTGFLAQEVEEVCKKLDFEFSGLHVSESEVGIIMAWRMPVLCRCW